MIMRTLALILALTLPTVAQAHEVWVERDGAGPARIYLGEPGEPMPAGGDPEFKRLVAPKFVGTTATRSDRRAGYIEAMVPAKGDLRVTDDAVFAPWGAEGAKEAVIYYARAGRSDTSTAMPYEIAPLTANGNRFALMQGGKPVADAKVTVVSPDKWTKVLSADANGIVTVPLRGGGRYLLSATKEETGQLAVPAGPVAKIYHTATTTFVAK
ncbi:nickel uptake transporter family protein [Sphingomonas sp. Leaf25]|nr:nickel uptake transporter family protein [Sphingomonas sp. Leaf25]